MVTWNQCAADLAPDGSLRDIYALEGGLPAWDALLNLARGQGARFTVGGTEAPLPFRAADVFSVSSPGEALLTLNWRGLDLASHFFAPEEVELDFVPNAVKGQQDLDVLCEFVSELARATGRAIIVTPENLPEAPFLRASPSGDVRYQAPVGAG
jgi:hypothetical protein